MFVKPYTLNDPPAGTGNPIVVAFGLVPVSRILRVAVPVFEQTANVACEDAAGLSGTVGLIVPAVNPIATLDTVMASLAKDTRTEI
jgi:hypothetical protein